eukprot:165487-Prorocentrum_minimum.AAC.2
MQSPKAIAPVRRTLYRLPWYDLHLIVRSVALSRNPVPTQSAVTIACFLALSLTCYQGVSQARAL